MYLQSFCIPFMEILPLLAVFVFLILVSWLCRVCQLVFFISLWSFVCSSVISSFFIPYLCSCFASCIVCICLMLYIFFVVLLSFCPLLFCVCHLCCVSLRSFLSRCLVSVVICVSCSSFVSLQSCITQLSFRVFVVCFVSLQLLDFPSRNLNCCSMQRIIFFFNVIEIVRQYLCWSVSSSC